MRCYLSILRQRVALLQSLTAKVGDLERTDTDWYLVVREKGANRAANATAGICSCCPYMA